MVLLSTTWPQSSSTAIVFAQEQKNNTSQGADTELGEIILEIWILLNQTVEAYNQQNYAEAEALATTEYIDNFEFIEGPLAKKDKALMENTEVMLREQTVYTK